MDMTGNQHIEAPRDVVWAALNDVEVLRQSIPGCQSIEKVSDTEMNAKVILKVGPVKATFTGKVTLSDLDPPNGYTITGGALGPPENVSIFRSDETLCVRRGRACPGHVEYPLRSTSKFEVARRRLPCVIQGDRTRSI